MILNSEYYIHSQCELFAQVVMRGAILNTWNAWNMICDNQRYFLGFKMIYSSLHVHIELLSGIAFIHKKDFIHSLKKTFIHSANITRPLKKPGLDVENYNHNQRSKSCKSLYTHIGTHLVIYELLSKSCKSSYIFIYYCESVNQIFPRVPNPFREFGESLK